MAALKLQLPTRDMQGAVTTLTSPRGARHALRHQNNTEIPETLSAGFSVGPWIVEGELGRGGMSTVYAVRHHEFGKRAALKLANRDVFGPRFTAERFLLEARVVNTVDHPDVVSIFDTGVIGDRPYLVMEALSGHTLGDRLEQGPIDLEEIIAIMLQLCDVLTVAHAAGVVHRDLKLDNVFLTIERGRPRVKLLDWGLANLEGEDPMADMIAGTPHYVAPEQVRGEAVTSRSDIYSLGVLAYVLFLGRAPFDAESSAEILTQQVKELPPPPKERWAEIPPALEKLIMGMLEKSPQDRPAMPAVIAALRSLRRAAVPPPAPRYARGTAPQQPVIAIPPVQADGDDHDRSRLALRVGSFTMPVLPVDVLGRMGVLPKLRKQWWVGAVVAVGLLVGGVAWRATVGSQSAEAATAVPRPITVEPITIQPAAVEPVQPAAVEPALVMPRASIDWGVAPLVIADATDTCEPAIAECTPVSDF
jgi:serine/threonine protein kinase